MSKPIRVCSVDGCNNRCKAHGFCKKHWARIERNGHLEISRRENGTGTIAHKGYLKHQKNGVCKNEHTWIVEGILGKPLPKNAQVHHVDGNKLNNSHINLVVCPDNAYHLMIERRTRAYEACGNADYRRCTYCRKYDDIKNMLLRESHTYHKDCRNLHARLKLAQNRKQTI